MIRNREMPDHLWVLALPVRRMKSSAGERIFLGAVLALATLIIVVIAAHVIFQGVSPLELKGGR